MNCEGTWHLICNLGLCPAESIKSLFSLVFNADPCAGLAGIIFRLI